MNAARMASGLGADVIILEVDAERMRFLDITMSDARTLHSNEAQSARVDANNRFAHRCRSRARVPRRQSSSRARC